MYLLFLRPFSHIGHYRVLSSSLHYTEGPRYSSSLYIVLCIHQRQYSILNVEALVNPPCSPFYLRLGVTSDPPFFQFDSRGYFLEAQGNPRGPSQPGICTWICAVHQPWTPGDGNITHIHGSFISMNWNDSFLNQYYYNFKVQNLGLEGISETSYYNPSLRF